MAWLVRVWARKYFDSIVYLSILDIDRIERLMPQLSLIARNRVILEPTNYKGRNQKQIVDDCSKVLGKYGRVEFLGYTDYQGRGMFAVYLWLTGAGASRGRLRMCRSQSAISFRLQSAICSSWPSCPTIPGTPG